MNARKRLLPLLSAALVVALSYVAGALAPPLRSLAAAAPQAATLQQQAAIAATISLLLSDSDEENLYLPLIQR